MRRPIGLSDGWYRIPGDDGEQISKRSIPFLAHYWVLLIDGLPFAVCKTDGIEDVGNTVPNGAMTRLLAVMDRDGNKSVYDLMLQKVYSQSPQCKWNGKLVNQSVQNPGISDNISIIFGHTGFKVEQDQVADAVEKMRPILRRTLQAWPFCGRGGKVELGGRLSRASKTIDGVWRCDCGE